MEIDSNKTGAAMTMVSIYNDIALFPALIDTGAACSMISEEFAQNFNLNIEPLKKNIFFRSAGKNKLTVLGTAVVKFKIGFSKLEERFYVTRNLSHNILIGGDIFWKHKIDLNFSTSEIIVNGNRHPLISTSNRAISTVRMENIDDEQPIEVEEIEVKPPSEQVKFEEGYLSDKEIRQIKALVDEFSDIFAKNSEDIGETDFVHKIKLISDEPVKSKAYRIPNSQKIIVEKELEKMLSIGVIKRSNSPWSSPVVLVKKKDGSVRFCVDYRRLNALTVKDNYPLPYIDETLEGFIGKTHFSTLDLISGYWQFQMDPESQLFTSFVTHKGTFMFLRMPFGLCNAGASFQRAMEEVCQDLPQSTAYIDDVITASTGFENHLNDLRKVFIKLRLAKLKIKPSKCKFGCSEIKFLGFIVSREGIKVCQSRSDTIENYPRPKNAKAIQRFIGLINYYRKFIKDFATIASPLTKLTRKKVPFIWSEDCETAFNTLKKCLLSPPILIYPDHSRRFKITTDASNVGLGAVLSQEDDEGVDRVIAYASRKLKPAEINYSTTEQELLAIVYAVEKYRPYVFGRTFDLVTDHKPLTYIHTSSSKSQRLTRWKLSLSEYSFDVKYKPGKENTNADVLSRIEDICMITEEGMKEGVTVEDIRTQQAADPNIKRIIERVGKPKVGKRQIYRLTDGVLFKLKEQCKKYESEEIWRLVIPNQMKESILTSCHDEMSGAHLGVNKTFKKISGRFFWPGMRKDVKHWISSCKVCAGKKNPQSQQLPTHSITHPEKPFEMVGMDFIGPLTETDEGNKHILVFTDYATRWVEAFPTKDQKACTVAKILIEEIICRHSAPATLLSDKGRNFLSEVIAEACKYFKIKKINTTSYHPQCNGLTEKFNGTLVKMLASYCDDYQTDWDEFLPTVLFAYRTSEQKTTRETPFRLLYGRDSRLPLDIEKWTTNQYFLDKIDTVWKEARSNIIKSADYSEKKVDMEKTPSYKIGELVMLNNPVTKVGLKAKLRRDKWQGPYKIIDKNDKSNVRLDINGKLDWVHVSRIKKAETRTRYFRLSKPPDRLEYTH